MKIRINDLPEKGLNAAEIIDQKGINVRLQDPENNQFQFIVPLSCTVTATPLGKAGAQIKGTVESKYTQGCSLCLENVPRDLHHTFEFQLRKKREGEMVEDDVGIFYFAGDNVELDSIIEEEIILSLSIFWHPEFESKKCSVCKKDKSTLGVQETDDKPTLGDLLKLVQ